MFSSFFQVCHHAKPVLSLCHAASFFFFWWPYAMQHLRQYVIVYFCVQFTANLWTLPQVPKTDLEFSQWLHDIITDLEGWSRSSCGIFGV